MDKRGRFQAKDIDNAFFLRVVDYLSNTKTNVVRPSSRPWDLVPHWTMRRDVERCMPMFPARVVLAKAAALIARGLLNGCTCGCRGDWEVTRDGEDWLRWVGRAERQAMEAKKHE